MIHKVNYLTSIGKYRNYVAVGQVDFRKMTLIFGDNGGGKTKPVYYTKLDVYKRQQ